MSQERKPCREWSCTIDCLPIFSRFLDGAGLVLVGFLVVSLFGGGEVLAQEVAGGVPQGGAATPGPGLDGFLQGLFRLLPLFGIVFFIFYFLVLRPQEAKEREHEALLKSAKNGTWLLTRGGIIGKLVASEEQAFVLEIANGVRVRCEKAAIVREVEGLSSGHPSGKGKR